MYCRHLDQKADRHWTGWGHILPQIYQRGVTVLPKEPPESPNKCFQDKSLSLHYHTIP